MKILYLCADAGIPVLGRKGASAHVRQLIEAFAHAGHHVTLAAQTLTKSPLDEPAYVCARVIHVPPDSGAATAVQAFKNFNERLGLENSLPGELRRILYNETLYQNMKRRFLRHRPTFIYERASLHATAGVRLAAKFQVPHIVELNAPLAVEQAAYRTTAFGELAAQTERWTLTHADAVVVVSSKLAEHVRALGVPSGRIHVMPNGVNPELFYPVSGPAHRAMQPTLGFVGGLRPWHGVEVLPEVLARLQNRHRNVRLLIAGDGQLKDELKRAFAKRGLRRNVRFTGLLAHEEIPAVIRRFDVALAPYPKHDHDFYFSPLKLFEYMACGVAVVAARQGQIAQLVRHGQTGWLYAPGDLDALVEACERLLDDAALRERLGVAAAKLVHGRFTWDNNAARVVALARKLRA
jgi:glycosyltransferase involved in cell wall biosynthesis